ncbi:MAG: uroporphyrinogen decarboxylase family protein [Armatimonadia bacterium]
MTSRIEANRRFLTDLFSGPFPGHGLIMDPVWPARPWLEDCAISPLPVADWVPWALQRYEAMLAYHEALEDDSVPYAGLTTGTEVFAAAFGCDWHLFEGSNPAAMPLVTTPAEADALEVPALTVRPLERLFEWGQLLRERLGPEVPIGIPDIQSPFDIAALIWKKDAFYLAMYEAPESVMRLVEKCTSLLKSFLQEFVRQFPECNLIHCPNCWAPPALGCSLSEDEAGCLSPGMFEDFCLPSLLDLSETFGGLFMHCCATADYQYENFKKIPRLRGLNRVFQAPGPGPAIEAFEGQTVLVQAWMDEATIKAMVKQARPESRFLFNVPGQPLEEAKGTLERLRRVVGR